MRLIMLVCCIFLFCQNMYAESDTIALGLEDSVTKTDKSQLKSFHNFYYYHPKSQLHRSQLITISGITLYGSGYVMMVRGAILSLNGFYGMGDPDRAARGENLFLIGTALYLAGPLVSGAGSSNAFRLLENSGANAGKPGVWGFYAAGSALKLATFIMPDYISPITWTAGEVFWITAMTRSYIYTARALNRANFSDVRIDLAPTFSLNGEIGARLVASF